MNGGDEISEREQLIRILDLLTEKGWIESSGVHTENYIIKWTPKGREMSRLVKELFTEIPIGPRGFKAFLAVCMLHAPDR